MSPSRERSAILVPLIAATFVWYEFHLFGSLATTVSPRFFSRNAPTLAAVAYFAPFAIGLIARPLGALLFGRVGDLKSRKRALSQTLLLTGITTLLFALLPGYVIIGVTAPIILLALRMFQGLAFGGVYAGALLFCAERAPANKRGFATGWIQMTPTLGLLLSIGVISVSQRIWGHDRFQTYGWRVAFLPSLILIALSIYMRRMEGTPASQTLQKTGTISLLNGLCNRDNLKLILVTLFLVAGYTAVSYMSQFYLMFHLQNVLKVNPLTATIVVVAALLLGLPFIVVFGALSDKVGRKKIIVWGCLLAAVLYIPAYAGMQRAANTQVVSVSPVRNFVTGAPGPTSLTMVDGILRPAAESANPNVFALTALVLLLMVIFAMVSGPLGAYFAECFPFEVRFTSTAFSYNVAHGVFSTLLPFFSLPLLVESGDIYAGLYYAIAVTIVSFLVGTFYSKRDYPIRVDHVRQDSSWIKGTLGLLLLFWPHVVTASDFKREVIYQIVTDRFFDGDPSNNDPPQSAGMYDPTRQNWQAYWGGDLEGIRQKLPYLAGMGVTAIWISLPADNLNAIIRTSSGVLRAPYHGYHPRDLKRIEEHFGDVNNTWAPFDNLVTAAHEQGIKIIVDFIPNHSSAVRVGEDGALYDNGEFLGKYSSDPSGYFHHLGFITDENNPFETQYFSLYGLADIDQTNPRMDEYLKTAAHLFQQHGADGFRIDALRHAPWGWMHSFANSVYTQKDSFIFGEWYLQNTHQPLYWDYAFSNSIYSPDNVAFPPEYRGAVNDSLYSEAFKLANESGIPLTDFPLKEAISNVFGLPNADFSEIDSVLSQMSKDLSDVASVVTFIDNHDQPRFLSTYNNRERFHLALAFLLTARGVPCIYYGSEHYLHNDTREGRDPYNRPMMDSFSTTTPAYLLINKLSALRRANPAIAYGSMERRWMDHDVYIYERRFSDHVVLVAINKSTSQTRTIDELRTSLPVGSYSDYLEGKFGGGSPINVSAINAGVNTVASFTLSPNTVAVWSYIAGQVGPQLGSVFPRVGQSGMKVTIHGDGFGRPAGTVRFGSVRAEVVSWDETKIAVIVPSTATGPQLVTIVTTTGLMSNSAEFTTLSGKLVPVVFNVTYGSPDLRTGRIFLSGSISEMGNWKATWRDAIPLVTPNGRDWTTCASLPGGQTIQFRVLKITDGGRVIWAGGDAHTYTVPTTGVGRVDLQWVY